MIKKNQPTHKKLICKIFSEDNTSISRTDTF